MPDADVREQLRLQHINVHTLEGGDIGDSRVEQQVLQVLGVSSQPVLQALHEVARVLRLLAGQELEHSGQRADLRPHMSAPQQLNSVGNMSARDEGQESCSQDKKS